MTNCPIKVQILGRKIAKKKMLEVLKGHTCSSLHVLGKAYNNASLITVPSIRFYLELQ